MNKIIFVVEGPLMGYAQTTLRSIFNEKGRVRSKKYAAFKNRVLLTGMQAGFPNMGIAVKGACPRLSVEVFWKKDPRIDWKNIYGAIEDSCWYEDDAFVRPGKFSDFHCDTGKEEAKVTVELA